jgi:hypothetical protein
MFLKRDWIGEAPGDCFPLNSPAPVLGASNGTPFLPRGFLDKKKTGRKAKKFFKKNEERG